MVAFEIARRRSFATAMEELPDGVERARAAHRRGRTATDGPATAALPGLLRRRGGSRRRDAATERYLASSGWCGREGPASAAHRGAPGGARPLVVAFDRACCWRSRPSSCWCSPSASGSCPGRWRVLRLFWFLLVYLVRESIGLVALGVLWVLSGFGRKLHSERFQAAHVVLIGWYLRGLVRAAARVLGLELVTEGGARRPGDARPARGERPVPPRPVLVFSRHAGAGDSLILVHLLVNTYRRRSPHRAQGPAAARPVHRRGAQPDARPVHRAPRVERRGRVDHRARRPSSRTTGRSSSSPRAATSPRAAGCGRSSDSPRGRLHDAVARADELTYVLPPRPAARSPRSTPLPTPTCSSSRTPGSSSSRAWGTSGAGCRWTARCASPGGPCTARTSPRTRRADVWLFEWWERIDTWIEERRDPDLPATPLVATLADVVASRGPRELRRGTRRATGRAQRGARREVEHLRAGQGLTAAEVAERVADGRVNRCPTAPSRTTAQIVRANVLTPINLIIGVLLVRCSSPNGISPDMLFAGVIVSNSLIGIVQELRARAALEPARRADRADAPACARR
jgi:hypothetical protein